MYDLRTGIPIGLGRDAAFPSRKPVLRWIPSIPIGIDWKREMPTTIKMIG